MKHPIRFSDACARAIMAPHEWEYLAPMVAQAHRMLHERTGPGRDHLGWVELPAQVDRVEYTRLKEAASMIRAESDVLVVIGIGGSSLGAKAVVELLAPPFFRQLPRDKRSVPEVYFLGNTLSPAYLSHVMEVLAEKEFSVNVISKSGTTTEPLLTFRLIRQLLEQKYSHKEVSRRIYVTTGQDGALKRLADEQGYTCFSFPADVGGRYAVLTAVGLLPIAVSGVDIDSLLQGARTAYEEYRNPDLALNPCYRYAALRNALYRKGKTIELLVSCEPQFRFFGEWWKQLFAESEGKDGKGIFPAFAEFPADLHSLGQYIQDGRRDLFETVIHVQLPTRDVGIGRDEANLDGLNFLAGQTLAFVNQKTLQGTLLAHTAGGVPSLQLEIPEISAYTLGALLYFFEKACAISGYLLGVNPFDQPAVQAYKQNMFALLGKPGYERRRAQLEARLREARAADRSIPACGRSDRGLY